MDASGFLCLAIAASDVEKFAEAADNFDKAAASSPQGDPRTQRMLAAAGNAWIAAGQPGKAALSLDRALTGNGLLADQRGLALLDRARAAEAQGDLKGARRFVTLAEQSAGEDPFTWYFSAALAIGEGDLPTARREVTKFLHSMLRVSDPQAAIDFFRLLGLEERRRKDVPEGKFTLIFLGAGDDVAEVELTHNWDEQGYDGGRNFGHLAFRVDDIYATCQRIAEAGVPINRPPRDGHMAFVRTPDGISIELLQKGEAQPAAEPWASMPNSGSW